MAGIPPPRWRTRRTVLVLVAVGALAVVAVGGVRAGGQQDGPGPRAVASLPPASPGVVSVGYVGSHWRLTDVADARGTTEIPESVDAWLELAADGRYVASDGGNAISGTFGTTGIGFDITEAASTLAGYVENDPVQLAAITGIDAMMMAVDGQAAHVTVLSADREHLTIQASGVRLTFVRTGPAGK
ncbi:META domain-containing protein [Actinoplanes sp. NPDC049668]|uniref:META domain-containing protein n=1 Tax=Actinoplanes sp. NPDC049668 TaxID=3363904 RepID=UPI0037885424